MRALRKAGCEIPDPLVPTRNALIASLPYLLRPNLTFPQFGDTTTVALKHPVSSGAVALAVLITVVPPDSPVVPASAFAVSCNDDTLVATWLDGDRLQQLEFPRPFA